MKIMDKYIVVYLSIIFKIKLILVMFYYIITKDKIMEIYLFKIVIQLFYRILQSMKMIYR